MINFALKNFRDDNTTGGDNTGSGYTAMFFNTTGSANSATGFQFLYSNTSGPTATKTDVHSRPLFFAKKDPA